MTAESGYPFDDIGIYLQPKQRGRVFHLEFNFPVDRSNAKESAKVEAIIHEAAKRLLSCSAFIYRPYGSLAEMVFSRTGNLHPTLGKMKEILDPKLCDEPRETGSLK